MTPAEFIDDPEWWKIVPETKETPSKRHLPSHEDCSRIEPEEAASHLKTGGVLGAMPGYEERPGQMDMARAVAQSFDDRKHLMIEAGTGVGKSLAYLVPSILWAWTNDTPVVVATATRNLQSQLMASDIPKAVEVLGEYAPRFKVALLKGRSNYLCLRELAEFFAPGYWTMSKDEQEAMPRFIEWLKTTEDGDLDGMDLIDRTRLSCPGEECGGRRCRYYSRCFVYRARKNAAGAHLIVANHALVLAEALSGAGMILPAYNRLVMDEAHNLESVATEYFSREISQPVLKRILDRLYRPPRGRRGSPSGALAAVSKLVARSLAPESVSSMLDAAMAAHGAIGDRAGRLLDIASRMMKAAKVKDGALRYDVKDGARRYSVRGVFKMLGGDDGWDEDALSSARLALEHEIASAVSSLHAMKAALEDDGDETSPGFADRAEAVSQIDGAADALVGFSNDVFFTLAGEKDDYAYWMERVRVMARKPYLRLVAAPLSVAAELAKFVYERKDSAILCSATLRVGNDFKYMAQRLGCTGERFSALVAASPFDYLRQATVIAADFLPDPTKDASAYAAGAGEIVKAAVAEMGGRTLVLFTSYEMMETVADGVRAAFAESGKRLLVQGEGLGREAMTAALKRDGGEGTVLFGAQSFWEGVDVAGEALSCVVITRLPFAQLGDPIVEARGEKIERDGGSAFRDYLLPEAAIKFRQGFGRLVRTKRDKGVVIVTDPRIVTKNYGAVFRRSIPASVHTVADMASLVGRMAEW